MTSECGEDCNVAAISFNECSHSAWDCGPPSETLVASGGSPFVQNAAAYTTPTPLLRIIEANSCALH